MSTQEKHRIVARDRREVEVRRLTDRETQAASGDTGGDRGQVAILGASDWNVVTNEGQINLPGYGK